MKQNIAERIYNLRSLMKEKGLEACIIPSSDPHISEYPADHWKSREWISGFTGSYGTVVITLSKAGLWTDSRYFLQAEEQLQNSEIELFREKLPGTPDMKDWLVKILPENATIGIDGNVFSAIEASALNQFFSTRKINIITNFDPFTIIWNNRPAIPMNKIFILPEEFSGASTQSKIELVLEQMHDVGANLTILASLDSIAWLFNIRGNDIEFNPVAISYAIISTQETVLFIHPEKLTKEAIDYLKEQEVVLASYDKIFDYISKLRPDKKILINQAKVNYALCEAIPIECKVTSTSIHPVDLLKSLKNDTEIDGFKNALKRDGVALVRFLIWLEQSMEAGEKITELDVSRTLREQRSNQEYYFGESFETIAGYAEHGAIVHYGPTEQTNSVLQNKGLLLVDSGAQYFDGTTDITRTIALGEINQEMAKDYTLVLKGHIALACAYFPKGTKGVQLDILARKALWENGLNYLHGTGHGIGHFLNVHEGPQSIRMEFNPMTIELGMITSNEPGIYRTNSHGVRIENLILTVEAQTTSFGEFYQFETITLCPIDKRPIDKSLLSDQEVNWLNAYHKMVFEKLSPLLSTEEVKWLKDKTDEL